MNSDTRPLSRLLAALAISIATPVTAQAPGAMPVPSASSWPAITAPALAGPRRFSTNRTGTFGGRRLRYRASLEEFIVRGRDRAPAGSIFTTSFVSDGEAAAKQISRPVLFVFNGGPGGSSNTLMFGALGPERLACFDGKAQADPTTPLVANPDSPLDAADLVFIDAPETGFGRPLPGKAATEFRSNDGDSAAFAQVILGWLTDRGRLGAPVYIAGESYGSLRAVMLARDLRLATPKVELAGLILISQAITYNGPASAGVRRLPDPVRAINRLPDIAALAWYHGLIDNRGQTLEQAVVAARDYALHTYAPALLAGARLPVSEKQVVAGDLQRLTGVPAATWLAGDLRLDNPRRQMLTGRNLALGQFDGRETEPLTGLPADEDRDWDAATAGLTAASERIARDWFKASGLPAYRTIVPDPYGFEKTWTYIQPPAPGLDIVLREQMAANPRLRLLVTQGVFDTTSSMGSTDYLFGQIAAPSERTVIARYAGGHMLYSDDAGRHAFDEDIRAFVSGKPVPSRGFPVAAPTHPTQAVK